MNLIKHKNIFFAISLCLLIPSILALLMWGIKPNIDFTGGSLLELEIESGQVVEAQQVREAISNIDELNEVQPLEAGRFVLQGNQLSNEEKEQVLAQLEGLGQVTEVKFESVGPILGNELIVKTINAVLLVAVLIIFYVWRQFKQLKYGICAITGMFHDSLILLGSFSIFGHFFGVQVDVLFVTALLTTLSFSIHDTIVIYDRIRELSKRHPRLPFKQVANLAIWETLARSINNSLTIIFMLAALVLLGGETIRWFSVALLIGAIAGTYSSTFTAVPLLVLWDEIKSKRQNS